MKEDYRLYNKYVARLEKYHVRTQAPTMLAIHGTAGGSTYNTLMDWMLGGERHNDYSRGIGLYNWLIDYDGTVYQILPSYIWAHASHAGGHNHSKMLSIGLLNKERDNSGEYTVEQYSSLINLVMSKIIDKHFKIRIISHDTSRRLFAPTTSGVPCPGNFDWKVLENGLISSGCEVQKINKEDYNFWKQ